MTYTPYYGTYMPNYYQPMQGYQQMQANTTPQISQNTQPAQQASNGIIWVQGEEGAKAYMVAPGNSVLLMDSENSAFYIKSTDASGMPQPLRVFDYAERTSQHQQAPTVQNPDYVTRAEFDALAARLDAMTKEHDNG